MLNEWISTPGALMVLWFDFIAAFFWGFYFVLRDRDEAWKKFFEEREAIVYEEFGHRFIKMTAEQQELWRLMPREDRKAIVKMMERDEAESKIIKPKY
jgi:hypothetical protein